MNRYENMEKRNKYGFDLAEYVVQHGAVAFRDRGEGVRDYEFVNRQDAERFMSMIRDSQWRHFRTARVSCGVPTVRVFMSVA